MLGRICAFFSQPAFFVVNGTMDLVESGREKNEADVSNMSSISGSVMPRLIKPKNPSVSAA